MSYHGYDPGDRNNWYQSPQLGLFPASPTGYGVGYYCLPSYHPHGTRFPSQQSYPPPPQFPSQPSYSPPPPPPSATIINGYVFPHQFPHLSANNTQLSTATPSPHNYLCSRNQSYSSPGLLTTTPQSPLTPVHPHPSEISLHYAPTQPYFVPTNHFVPPPSTHEQPRLISDLKQVEPALQLRPISMELDQVHKDQLEARISKTHDSFEVIRAHVKVLDSTFSAFDADHAAAKVAARALVELAKNEDNMKDLVECGAVPALVNHLRAPPPERGGSHCPIQSEHEVEKESAFALNLIAVKPENQHLIVDAGGLSPLIDLLKRHKSSSGSNAGAVDGVIRRAADAICNISHENRNIKNLVRIEGGIPPLVELLNFIDTKVQRAAAGALKILAFKNDENKNQIVECNALPNLVLMLLSEIATMTYEAIGVIGNLVHSSPSIKKLVLLAGALQPVIDLLSSPGLESQREAALLLGQFATADSDCKAHVQRGAVQPLIKMLQSPDSQVREMSAFAIRRLAQDTHNQAGIAHMRVTNEDVQSRIALAFAHLCKNDDCHVIFIEHKGMKLLLGLLESKSLQLQHDGSLALHKMATKATPLSLDVIAESLMVVAQALCIGLHIILAYTFYEHCSMVVEASIILRYFSFLHSFLDSVDFRSAMLNFIQYWSCLVHARDYLFMTYTVHTLSLPVATMFIKDVTGGNLYLFEVAILHFLCQTKAICHPRRFFVDEVIDFLKSNLKSSFLRYYFDPLRPRYNCGCFVTNMHKFFQYMVGHIHKDELFMTTCPSIFYTPFHALVRKLFLLSPMVAVHSLQLLLADILREDAQLILGIMMVLSMNELMLLNSKKQGLEIGECPLEAMWLSVDVIELHMNFLENHMKLDEKCLGYVMSALDALYRMQKLRFKFIYQNLLQLFFPYVSVFVIGEEFRSDLFYMQPAGLGKKTCRLGHGKTHNFCSLSDDAHTLGLMIINRASAFLLLRVTQIAQINRAANICLEHRTVFLEKRGVENVHKWGWYKLRIVVNAVVGVDYFFQATTMREFRQEDAGNGIPLVFAPNIQDSEKDGGLIVNDEDVRAGVVLHDDGMMIVEDDITDGDKEPTIPLLWNMFVHLQLPLLAKKTTLAYETCKIKETMDGSINADSPPIFSGFCDLALTMILYSLWLIRAWHKSMGYLPFEDSNYPTMPWFIYIFLDLGVTLCSGHVAADIASGYGFQMISCKGAQILIQNMKLEDKFV